MAHVHAGDAWHDAPFRFDRRRSERWSIEGIATAFELGGEGFGRTHTLHTLDYSHAGVGAVCESPVPPGTSLSVGFETPGYPARRGVVTRCLPCGDGYRVAVAFEQRLAA